MDEFDHPFGGAGNDIGIGTILTYLLALTLCLTACLMSFSEMSQAGPDIGEIVTFDPHDGPKHWEQAGIPVQFASATNGAGCVLSPAVISVAGGSFVIEAKQLSRPAVFRVHWSGGRTDMGGRDCGRSADLVLPLVQLRALANVAGGYGVEHGWHW
jgi:hypothetical protein